MAITNTQLATKMSELLDKWRTMMSELTDWLGGPVDGGPNADGEYPLTNPLGEQILYPGLVKVQEVVNALANDGSSTLASAQTSAAGAATSATLAQQWASQLASPVDGTDYSAKYHALAASVSAAEALSHADRAEAAATVTLPTTGVGDAGKAVIVNPTEDGFILGDVNIDLTGYATQQWVTDQQYATTAWATTQLAGKQDSLPTFSITEAGKVLKVNGSGNLAWMDDLQGAGGSGVTLPTFGVGQAGLVLKVNASGGLEWSTDLQGAGSVDLTAYATEAWVNSQGFLVSADLTAYATITYVDSAVAGKADSVHTHAIGDVTGLQTELDGKASASHTHAIADVTGLQTTLDGKADSVHTHAIADVANLQTALDGKASASHTHAISDVTGLQTALDGKQGVTTRATVTASQNVTSGDIGSILDCTNGTDITLTLPAALDLTLPVTIQSWGTGNVIIQAAAGVTVNGTAAGSVTVTAGEAAYVMSHPSTADTHRVIGALV